MKLLIVIVCSLFCSCLCFSQKIITKAQDCKKTELYSKLKSKDVVIYVDKFDLKTGAILKQRFLRGKGKVPKYIQEIMPLMDRKHFKNDKYIYAYTTTDKTRGGSTLLMVHDKIVESIDERIAIDALIKAFKEDRKNVKKRKVKNPEGVSNCY